MAVLPTSRQGNRIKGDRPRQSGFSGENHRAPDRERKKDVLCDEQVFRWLTQDEQRTDLVSGEREDPAVICIPPSDFDDPAVADPHSDLTSSNQVPEVFEAKDAYFEKDSLWVPDDGAVDPDTIVDGRDFESVLDDEQSAHANEQPQIVPLDSDSETVAETPATEAQQPASSSSVCSVDEPLCHINSATPIPIADASSPPASVQPTLTLPTEGDNQVVSLVKDEEPPLNYDQHAPSIHAASGSELDSEPKVGIEPPPDDVSWAPESPSPPRQKRPAPPRFEDASEFVVRSRGLPDLPDDYAAWNRGLAEYCLLRHRSAGDTYLCITPTILAAVMTKFSGMETTPQEAEAAFSSAVSRAYQARVLAHHERLRTLRRCGSDGLPECVAFLAASVLAAYRMQTDEEAAGHAYYVRLAELLACSLSGTYPVGFNPLVFESLWRFLRNWLDTTSHVRLAVPTANVDLRRFVALPLAHVPLRCLDIDKLPSFFAWAGYLPRGIINSERLLADLINWDRARSAFTPAGASAIADDRRAAVVAQVAAELITWDGAAVDSLNRRSALVEVMLDIVQRKPNLAFLPRRPAGFPEQFNDGDRVFEAADQGWYDPAPIGRTDGPLLANGFEWKAAVNGGQMVLRRPATRAIVLAPSEYSGYLSNRELLRGVKCAVLCRDADRQVVADYLSDVSQTNCRPAADPRLPEGWNLFTNVVAQRATAAPSGLDVLAVGSNSEIIVSGGLRLGRRTAWLAGSPPRLFATGIDGGERPTINGEPVDLGDDGLLQSDGLLDEPGVYLIEASGAQQRIEIVEPQITPASGAPSLIEQSGHQSAVALPSGSWTLLGAKPGQIKYPQHRYYGGVAAKCPFQPILAVQSGAGPGVVVYVLENIGLQPHADNEDSPPSRRELMQWASAIYAAHIRRPAFRFLKDEQPAVEVEKAWGRYVSNAKQIKRLHRKK